MSRPTSECRESRGKKSTKLSWFAESLIAVLPAFSLNRVNDCANTLFGAQLSTLKVIEVIGNRWMWQFVLFSRVTIRWHYFCWQFSVCPIWTARTIKYYSDDSRRWVVYFVSALNVMNISSILRVPKGDKIMSLPFFTHIFAFVLL